MTFHGTASPEQLAILQQVLDDHCGEFGIADSPTRESLAGRIMVLFASGFHDLDQIKTALRADRAMTLF